MYVCMYVSIYLRFSTRSLPCVPVLVRTVCSNALTFSFPSVIHSRGMRGFVSVFGFGVEEDGGRGEEVCIAFCCIVFGFGYVV